MGYEDRYVAFIDILGFSELVRRSSSEADLLGRLVGVLSEIRNYKDSIYKDVNRHLVGLEISSFSDCIVVSAKCSDSGLGFVLGVVIRVYNELFHQGIFLRGAICKGRMIHNEGIVLGQGMISAYKLESGTAMYPRVIFDTEVAEDFLSFKNSDAIKTLMRKGEDGLWFLHVFDVSFLKVLGFLNGIEDSQTFMALGRKEIEAGINTHSSLAIKAKNVWLANYFNEFARACGLPEIKT